MRKIFVKNKSVVNDKIENKIKNYKGSWACFYIDNINVAIIEINANLRI